SSTTSRWVTRSRRSNSRRSRAGNSGRVVMSASGTEFCGAPTPRFLCRIPTSPPLSNSRYGSQGSIARTLRTEEEKAMADPARAAKMADRIKVIVAKTLERGLRDPRLGFVTITDVKVTGDLQHASVFYTV